MNTNHMFSWGEYFTESPTQRLPAEVDLQCWRRKRKVRKSLPSFRQPPDNMAIIHTAVHTNLVA